MKIYCLALNGWGTNPISIAILRDKKFEYDVSNEYLIPTFQKRLKEPVSRAKFDEKMVRCIFEIGKEVFYLDSSGVLRFKNQSYYIYPWLFLYIHEFNSELIIKRYGKL